MKDSTKRYEDRLQAWERVRFSPPPEPDLKPIGASIIEQVPMRDGIKLYTEVFLPAGDVQHGEVEWPVILLRSPYPYSRLSRIVLSM